MPRDGSGVYTKPYPNVVTNTTIASTVFNGNTADVETDLNAPRPIIAGGTGATTAAGALTNLGGVAKAGDTMTGDLTINKVNPALLLKKTAAAQTAQIVSYTNNLPRWLLALGNANAESGSNAGSDFTLYRYDDAGAVLGVALDINRATALAAFAGNVQINKASPTLILNKGTAAADEATIFGNRNGVNRWGILMGQGAAETGSNAGSDFVVARFSDAGAYLGAPLQITRASGALQFNGNTTVNGGYLVVIGSTPTQGTIYFGNTGTKNLTYDGTNFGLYGGPLVVSNTVFAATDATHGTYQFGLSGGKYLTFDGTSYSLVGGSLSVNGGTLQVVGATPTTGTVYFGNTLSRYLSYDGVNFNLAGGNLATGNAISAQGINGTVITASTSLVCQAANPILWMRDAGGTNKGYFLWEPANNEVYFYNAVAAQSVSIEPGGGVRVGTGKRTRPGASGAYGSNLYNISFAGSAHMWIDNTDNGQIAYVSDYRIKKDVADLPATWGIVKALRPIKYTQAEYTPTVEVERKLKEAQDRVEQGLSEDKLASEPMYAADDIERWGFIAHELQETLTQSAASAYKDAPDAVQSPNPWTVIAALTKALQEAMARIEALETAQVAP